MSPCEQNQEAGVCCKHVHHPETPCPKYSKSLATLSAQHDDRETATPPTSVSDLSDYERHFHSHHENDLTVEGECSEAKREKQGRYADFASKDLYCLLQNVDPESAKLLHPKDRRKIVRYGYQIN